MGDDDLYGDSVYESGDAVDDAEELDPFENLTGNDPDEIMQTGYDPPDRETHNLRERLTGFEEREGESLDERLSEEEPDLAAGDEFSDEGALDGTDFEDAGFGESRPRAGRLLAPDEGGLEDAEKDEVAEDVGPAGYGSSAEEAAVHVIDEDDL